MGGKVMFDRSQLAFWTASVMMKVFQLFSMFVRVTFWFFVVFQPSPEIHHPSMSHSDLNDIINPIFFLFAYSFVLQTFDNVSYFILRRLLNIQALWIPLEKNISCICAYTLFFLLPSLYFFCHRQQFRRKKHTKKYCVYSVFGLPVLYLFSFSLSVHFHSFRAIDKFQVFMTFCHLPKWIIFCFV